MKLPFVLRTTHDALQASFGHQSTLIQALEAELFKHDPNWQDKFTGRDQVYLKTEMGYVDLKTLVGKRLLLQQEQDVPEIDTTRDLVEVTVAEVAGSFFLYSYSRKSKRHLSFPSRVVTGWASFDNNTVLAVLEHRPDSNDDDPEGSVSYVTSGSKAGNGFND